MPNCNKIFYYRASLRKHIETSHLNYVTENNIKDPYSEVIEILKSTSTAPILSTQPTNVFQASIVTPNTVSLPTPSFTTDLKDSKLISGNVPPSTSTLATSIPKPFIDSITQPANQPKSFEHSDVSILFHKCPQNTSMPEPAKFITNYDFYEGKNQSSQITHELKNIRIERILDPITHPHVHQEYCAHLKLYHHNHMDYLHDEMLHMVVEYGNYNIRPNLRA